MEKAVVCVSGGMDSLCALATAIGDKEVTLLHVNYTQRTELREHEAFRAVGRWYNIPEDRMVVVETNIFKIIGKSCLTDPSIKVPEDELAMSVVPISYVPFRNGNILSMATALAEAIEAKTIYTGFVEVDSSGYPDCTEEFKNKFIEVIKLGTRLSTNIDIVTPCIFMTKLDITRFAIALEAPVHLSWSCYQSSDKACGKCDSCILRIRGFMQAGYIDPIPYAINIDWKHCKRYQAKEFICGKVTK